MLPSRDEDVTLGNFGGAEGEGFTFVFGLLACEIWPDSLMTADRMGRRSNRRLFSTWREAIETITGFTAAIRGCSEHPINPRQGVRRSWGPAHAPAGALGPAVSFLLLFLSARLG